MKRIALLLSACACVGCGPMNGTGPTNSSTTPPGTSAPGTAATARDNTAVNERDRAPAAKTPIDQNENQRDIQITADIRKAIIADKGMSLNGQNVKIITADGKVTLRGPVHSMEEKSAIEKYAMQVAGDDHVTSELEIAK